MTVALTVILCAGIAAAAAAAFSCVPGLHVYNVMGALAVSVFALAREGVRLPPEALVACATAMVVAYPVASSIPSILLSAPDESALFTVLPGQKLLMAGRGHEAVLLTTAGAAGAVLLLVGVCGPLAPLFLPAALNVTGPHLHWIVWCVIAFMLMSEWPKGGAMGQGGWERLRDGWRSTGAGLLTFAMSGLLGFVLMYRSPVPPDAAFQNLMPAFIGLFTVPWLLLNIVTRVSPPPQRVGLAEPLGAGQAAWGVASGCAGGAFAAFVPAVTGGVGAMLAGHAAPSRDSRVFLVSQGASRVFYYAGGFLLFFVPGPRLTRGGAAWLMRGIHEPGSFPDYCVALASAAVAGAVCVALAGPMAAGAIRLVERHGYRRVSWVSLALVCACVACLTGPGGAAVAAVATGIGLIPVLFGSRRMNCLGVILLPVACNMSGVGPTVAGWLGLL